MVLKMLRETRLGGATIVILLLLTWELFSRLSLIDPLYMPPVTSILEALWSVLRTGELPGHYAASLVRAGMGYGLATLCGVVFGTVIGYALIAYNLTEPLVELLRPIPSTALIPLAILFLGIGDEMKVFIIAWASFWPILLNTIDGVRSVDRLLVDTALTFGSERREIIRKIILPAAAPQIATGMRVSLALALILTVVVEMISGNNGIGFFILDSERAFRIKEMFAGTFSLAVVGYLLNRLFITADSYLLGWHRGLTSKEQR